MSHHHRAPHRGRMVAICAAAATATVVAAIGVVGCTRNSPSARRADPARWSPGSPASAGGRRTPAGGRPSATATAGPSPGPGTGTASALIPSSGAYLGAYVQPAQYTPQAGIAAIRSFQRSIGGPLALVHTYHPWDDPFPDALDRYVVRAGKVLLLTWSGTSDTRKIIAGDYDAMIRSRALAVKRLGAPILLEFRHEMDRPNLRWAVHGPREYIAAWDHIRAIFAQVGTLNVGWVWCPTGYGFERGRAQPFYPGDSEVDWVCADIYSTSTSQSLQQAARPFLRWATATRKPVLIGEFAVNDNPGRWPAWLLGAGALTGLDKQIEGIAYFDANGIDSNGNPFQYWLGGNPPALRAFAELRTWREFQPVLRPGP